MEEDTLLRNQYKFQWIFAVLGLNNNIIFIILLSSSKTLMKDKMYILSICTIIPGLLTKLSIPILNKSFSIDYRTKIYFSNTISILSIAIISYFHNLIIKSIMMILISITTAVSESVYIPLATLICDKSISYWSAGSGIAGILGSIYYVMITQILNLSPQISLLYLIWIPLVSIVSIHTLNYPINNNVMNQDYRDVDRQQYLLWCKLYIFPLGLVYFLEYTINLCILPHVYINNQDINIVYPRYLLCYQVGVLLSRSSKLFIEYQFDRIYIFPLFQLINLILLTVETEYHLINNLYIIYIIVLFEGVIGGLCYILTFSKINKYEPEDKRELCCLNTSIGEVIGQSVASLLSILN